MDGPTPTLGQQIRKARTRAAMTLENLSALTGISKPYLSMIETGNHFGGCASDEKFRRLEKALKFKPESLVIQAHVLRTPEHVRQILGQLRRDRDRLLLILHAHRTGRISGQQQTKEELDALLAEADGIHDRALEERLT